MGLAAPTAAHDRFLVGLAVLSLVAVKSDEQPLLCLVDDAQWLDHASLQTLAFMARRLTAEPIAVVFALREGTRSGELAGLPTLVLRGLEKADAHRLLASAVHAPLDEHVRDRIVAEAHGNPLALQELPRGLSPDQLAGGFAIPDAGSLTTRIEHNFLRRVESLPRDTRLLLLIAAAEPVGEMSLLWRAARQLGVSPEAAAPAEAAELIDFGVRIRFRHPLVRSAIYHSAVPGDRRTVHRALAEATDPSTDPDRRAWHGAYAAIGPDEDVALELERSAARAQDRAGLAAAAAFRERAAALTLDPGLRRIRSLTAAQAMLQAGAPEPARELLRTATSGPLSDLDGARADLLAAQIAFAVNRGSEAPPLLLKAARQLERLDPALARDTYLEALSAAMFAGRLAVGVTARDVAEAARSAPQAVPAAATSRSAAGRVGDPVHGRLRSSESSATAGGRGLLRRRSVAGGRDPVAVAGLHHRRRSVGRRELVHALRPLRDARARSRRAERTSARSQPSQRRVGLRGPTGRGRGVGRGNAGGEQRDRQPPGAVRRPAARPPGEETTTSNTLPR